MNLLLKNALERSKRTEAEFFRMCHIWLFGKDQMCHNDVAQYKLYGVIPKYVQEYIHYIEDDGDGF